MRKLLPLLIICSFCFVLEAQPPAPPNNLSGVAMRSWLKSNWYDNYHNQLGYSEARRKMYAYIDNENGVLTCVYSGFSQTNPYGNEITYPNPINCEHTVPQSFYNSSEPMRSDIHHLFPTYGSWNSARSSYKFGDIDDSTTQLWMRLNQSQATIPSSLIDEYAESNVVSGDWQNPNNRFEVREDHKGDAARSIFYFYTVYSSQAGPITDVASLATLCEWHANDPISAKEIERNNEIEFYQGNRNPYIDYPDLAIAAWGCPAPGVKVAPRILLEGPYNTGTNRMNDNLRTQGVLPLTEPFTGLGFGHSSPGGGESASSTTFDISGTNAIVDWIFLELRDPSQPTSVVATRAALLQADGDVVDLDGVSPVLFAGIMDGSFYLSIKSRNHLGVMSSMAIQLTDASYTSYDFTQDMGYGMNAQKILPSGNFALYEGDLNADGMINADDRSQAWNFKNQSGYLQQDSNLDGNCDASDRSQNWNNRNIISQTP